MNAPHCPFSGATFNPFAPPHHENMQALFAQARREEPVFFSEPLGSWVVTRYEDIHAILQDTRRFSSVIGSQILEMLLPEPREYLRQAGYRDIPLLFDDPPEHTRSRQLVARLFSKESLASLEPIVRALAEEMVDGFVLERQVDLIPRLVNPLPLRVLFVWLGLPLEMMDTFKQWAFRLTQLLSRQAQTLEEQNLCVRAVTDMQRYVAGLLSERMERPREDGMSVLTERLAGAASQDPMELAAMVMVVLSAGHETSSGLLGMAVRVLLEEPERWRRLREQPQALARWVEEILRYESPVTPVARMTTTEVEVAGVKLPAGVRVMLFLISGNRDERRFPEPDRFDPARPDVGQHLAFAKGIHVCVGAGLARLEARVMLEVLIRRLPGLRLAEPPRFIPGAVRLHERLLVAWD